MFNMKVIVVFLTLFGTSIPKDGVEGPLDIVEADGRPMTWDTRAACEADGKAALSTIIAKEKEVHKTDKFEVKIVCEPAGTPA
jgi:hypothetical protein